MRRSSDLALLAMGLALTGGPVPARAAPHPASSPPLHRYDHEYAQQRRWRSQLEALEVLNPSPANKPRAANPLDLRDYDAELTLDPVTGAAQARVKVKLFAVTALDQLSMLLDRGLAVTSATVSSGQSAVVAETPFARWNYAQLSFSTAIPAGTEAEVIIEYGGTLLCLPESASYSGDCLLGADRFLFFNQGSLAPLIVDGTQGYGDDRMTKAITLKVPSGATFTASGELVSDLDDGVYRTLRWEIPRPMPHWYSFFLIGGKISSAEIPGTAPPADLVFETGSTTWNAELSAWSPPILEFLEAQAGAPLPYGSTQGVKIPHEAKFIGTVAYGMTLLADTYAGLGLDGYEETWAHELSHQWWATIVSPSDYAQSRLLTEGLATLTETDYIAARHHPDVPLQDYLAYRLRENDLLMRYLAPDTPPLVAPSQLHPAGQPGYTVWAYYKGAAALDHLRVTMGEAAFAQGLKDFAAGCAFVSCGTEEFRGVMETASGMDLKPFFDRFIYGSAPTEVTLAFEQTPSASGAGTELHLTIARASGPRIRLEFWIELEDGSVLRRHFELTDTVTSVKEPLPSRARRVRLNPRHAPMVHLRSDLTNDLDLDGTVDGIDVLRCAHLEGRRVRGEPGGWNVFGVDLAFDPSCDPDGDGLIEPAEIDSVSAWLGEGVLP